MKILKPISKISLYAFFIMAVVSVIYFLMYLKPPRYTGYLKPSDFALKWEDVNIKSKDGIKLYGWYIAQKNIKSAIIILHGWPSDKSDLLPYTNFLSQKFNLLYTDLRGMGESGGYICGGKKEIEDIKRWIDFLKSKGNTRIGIFGYSYGGFLSLRAVNEINEIDFAIADSPFDSIKKVIGDVILEGNPFLKIIYPFISMNYQVVCGEKDDTFSLSSSFEKIKKKTLIICGEKDKICYTDNIKTYQTKNSQIKVILMKDLTHNETLMHKDYKDIIKNFINEVII